MPNSKLSALIKNEPTKSWITIYRKCLTPNKSTNSADNNNKQNLPNKLKNHKIINSNRQNKIEHEKFTKIHNLTKKKMMSLIFLHKKK